MIPSRRDIVGTALSLAVSICVAAIVLGLAGGVLAATGTPIAHGIGLIVAGAVGSPAAIHEALTQGGIVILTGLAAALAFRIKLTNFGAEGQLQAGALIAVGIASVARGWPAWAILPIELVAGAVAGAVIMAGATLLKLRRGVDEGIVTLLINLVMVLVAELFLDGRPGAGLAADSSGAPLGLIIAITAAVLIAAAIHLTVWGFDLRATAGNAEAARYAGIPVARVTLRVGIISGALAGLAGVCLFADAGSAQHPGLGYAGIAVAVLARFSPIGSIIAGLFIAALMVGAEAAAPASAAAAIPGILIALAVLASLLGLFVRDRIAATPRAAS
jgi:simple sugar transport system permease protein